MSITKILEDIPNRVDSYEAAVSLYDEVKDIVFDDTQKQLKLAISEGKKIVLVYQMGKVGSTSYAENLASCEGLKVFHVHRLNSDHNVKMVEHFLKRGMVSHAISERKWQAIAEYLRIYSPEIFIISAMRNPIDRNMSAYFQNLDIESDDPEKLISNFLREYPHEVPITWFDEQLYDALGINIFDYSFNKARGWDTLRCGNYKCLLITAETEDLVKVDAINQTIGVRLENITRKNVGKNKSYSELYRKFKESIYIPDGYLDSQLSNRTVQHFYTEAKINEFRSNFIRLPE